MADQGLTGRQPKAVQSALSVLECVAVHWAGVTAKEVALALDMPPATAYRLLNLLVGEEYLVRLPDLRGFGLEWQVASRPALWRWRGWPTAARQVQAELRKDAGVRVPP